MPSKFLLLTSIFLILYYTYSYIITTTVCVETNADEVGETSIGTRVTTKLIYFDEPVNQIPNAWAIALSGFIFKTEAFEMDLKIQSVDLEKALISITALEGTLIQESCFSLLFTNECKILPNSLNLS